MSFVYLASPYSDKSDLIRHDRFLKAEEVAALYLQRSIWVYSPIVHCHEMAKRYHLPKDFPYWQSYNEAMLELATELHILQLEGWNESKGVKWETKFAISHNIPITFIPYPLREKVQDESNLR